MDPLYCLGQRGGKCPGEEQQEEPQEEEQQEEEEVERALVQVSRLDFITSASCAGVSDPPTFHETRDSRENKPK